MIADTAKTHNSGMIPAEESYSVLRAVVEWRTGGILDEKPPVPL
jgi:hypothetical protein